MEIGQIASGLSPGAATTSANSFAALSSEDFFELLITQITNQDPLEPTGNAELMAQIAAIRDIELSTTLTESLRALTGQQQFTGASSLIGQYATGATATDGVPQAGIVVGVRFQVNGEALLQLANGTELPLSEVVTIQAPQQAAEALIGRSIVGVDKRDPSDPEVVEGVVTSVRIEDGEVMLELDSGGDLRFRDFVGLTTGTA